MLIRSISDKNSLKNNPVHSCSIFLRVVLISLLCTGSFFYVNKVQKKESGPSEKLSFLRSSTSKEIFQRKVGGFNSILEKEILQQELLFTWENKSSSFSKYIDAGICAIQKIKLRKMWRHREFRCASQGSNKNKQYSGQFNDIMRFLPHEVALGGREGITTYQLHSTVCDLWSCMQNSQWVLQQTLYPLEQIWRSTSYENQSNWWRISTGSGSGLMHKHGLSHLIE